MRAKANFDTPFLVETRNRRSVFSLANEPYGEEHYAAFPQKLVEPMVLATCPARVCSKCGAGWTRITEQGAPVLTGKGGSRKQRELIKRQRGEGSLTSSCFATGVTWPL